MCFVSYNQLRANQLSVYADPHAKIQITLSELAHAQSIFSSLIYSLFPSLAH